MSKLKDQKSFVTLLNKLNFKETLPDKNNVVWKISNEPFFKKEMFSVSEIKKVKLFNSVKDNEYHYIICFNDFEEYKKNKFHMVCDNFQSAIITVKLITMYKYGC